MDLYRKYRPNTFKELVGNIDTKTSLEGKIKEGKLPHAILLTGESGTGKTTIGRIIANELNAVGRDYREIDSADFRGIDTVRSIRRQMIYHPSEGDAIVYLLDEAALLGQGGSSVKNLSQSALLKALEDPPNYLYFILCTTDPLMLMKTIRSRCTHYEMEMLTEKQLIILVNRIAKREKVKLPNEITLSIALACKGKPRRALTILEKIIHLPTKAMKKQVLKENETESSGFELAKLLFNGGSWQKAIMILKTIENENPEQIRRTIYGFMKTVISKKANERAHYIMFCFDEPLYDDGMNKLWYLCHGILNGYEL
jgi:DNA polymerase-3 subunit gamma/tau